MSQIIKLDNPFRKYQREIIQVKPGESIEQIVKREMKCECEIITFINSQLVPAWERPKRILNEDEFLFIAPKVAGDDAGKTILNIAIMIGFWYTGVGVAQLMWAGPMATIGLKVGFLVGGAMLISALTPTPKMPSSGFIDDEESQSFGWNPATVQRQGISISRAYGLNKMYGNVVAVHTEKETTTFPMTTITETFYYKERFAGHKITGTRLVTKPIEFDPRKVDLNALFCLGMGPFREAVVSGTLKLNDQKIENLDNVSFEERPGDLRQLPVSYFNQTKLEVVVNRLVVNGTPVTYTTKNGNYDDLEIELSFPQGLFDGSGADLANNTVNVTVEIKKTIASTWTKLADNIAITDNVGDKVIETYSTVGVFTVDYGSNYDIRITKETAERDSIRYGDDLYLDKVREIIDHQFIYPRRALVGINAQATDQLSGSIRFSCLSRGLYIRTYDGSWSIKYSNNPAWVIYDILTQPVYTGAHSPWLDLNLLLNFNGADEATSTLDESERGHTVNFTATAQLDTAEKKFGTASLLHDGDSDDVNIANDEYSFDICENTVEDWTVDFFVKHADHDGDEYYITQYEDGDNRWLIHHVHGSGLRFHLIVGGITVIDSGAGLGEITDTNWHHIAFCKVGHEYGLYLDETQIAYVHDESVGVFDGSLFIGQNGADGGWFQGHIDHLRIIKQNIFAAAPNVGLTDTITEPAAEYTDPGNSYAVSRYDGYDPSKLLTADFEELADWCDDAEINPVNFGIASISQATKAIIVTRSNHNLKVGDTILFRDVSNCGMVELVDGTTAEILKVTNDTTFTIDLDTSGYTTFEIVEKLIYNFEHPDGSDWALDESDFVNHAFASDFVGNAEVDTAQKKFGTASLSIPNTGSNIEPTMNDSNQLDVLANLNDSYTIDIRVKLANHASWEGLISNAVDEDNFWQIDHGDVGGIGFESKIGAVVKISAYGTAIDDNDWHWVVVVKKADKIGVYLDGVQVAYDVIIAGDLSTYGNNLFLGCTYHTGAQWWEPIDEGWIDGVKITKSNVYNASPVVGLTDIIIDPNVAPTLDFRATVEKYQPRFAFNGIFDTESNMWEAALSVCELCRCIPFWDGDIIRLAIDKADSSVYAFTMGNILKDTFKQKFIPTAERASEIEVHYRDAAKDYVRMPFTLVNDDIGNTTSKTRLDLFGITDTDMANRLADFKLLQNLNLKKIAIWEADIESIACTIGDIVDVQHDVTNWGSIGSGDDNYTGGGRIVSATNEINAVITIEGSIYFDDADFNGGATTYGLLIKPSTDAVPESKTIIGLSESSVAGGSYDITVSGEFAVEPKKDDVWAAGIQNFETNKYRIIDIRRTEENRAELTAIEYNSDIYAND